MKNIFIYCCLAISFILNSCSGTKKPADTEPSSTLGKGSEEFFSHRWLITEINQRAIYFLGEGKQPELLFSPGQVSRLSGNTGCNNITGTFELSGVNKIKFSPLATTRMMCPNGMENETALLDALNKVNNYYFSGDDLMLLNGKTLMVKLRGVAASTIQFAGIWDLDYISGPRIAFSGLYPDKKPFVTFNFASGEMSGNTSCNGFTSKFTMKENTISIADPLKTMIMCEGDGENTFINMMKKVNRYSISDEVLTFLIDDVAVMRFAKRK